VRRLTVRRNLRLMCLRIPKVTDGIDQAQAQALQALRLEIDGLDQELLTLLNRRAECALEVAVVKEQSADNEPAIFYRPEREAQVLRGLVEKNLGPLSHEKVALIFRQVMSACLALEEPMQVAFLGPEGTFTQQATLKHFGEAVIGRPFVTVDEVFREVAAENCHYGVVPVENSTEGVVNHTLDNFLTSSLRICGECELKVHHHFMAIAIDAPLKEFTRISKPLVSVVAGWMCIIPMQFELTPRVMPRRRSLR